MDMLNGSDASFRILCERPTGPIENSWRACLADSDLATHYTAPEYFMEPSLRGKKPFAILAMIGDEVTGVLTGVHFGDRVQSGLSQRPQIALSRRAERARAMNSLLAGLLDEARSAKLVDLFLWSELAGSVDARLQQRQYEGVVMLDLTQGPDAIFRKFSQTRRSDIRKAIKLGVSTDTATSRDHVAAFYSVYVDWSRRKQLPFVAEEEMQETFALTANRRLFLARYNGQVVAGVAVRFYPGGVMEYAANSSLQDALHLRPNDLLQWRAIEWACAEGITKYSLGGAHLFSRKSGGAIMPTIRCRLDLSLFRRHALGDWIADKAAAVRPLVPQHVVTLGRALRRRLERHRA